MSATSIAWADHTWNPVKSSHLTMKDSEGNPKIGTHCVLAGPECTNCYAQEFNARILPNLGHGLPYIASSTPLQTSYVDLAILAEPLHWKKPRFIFPCSMTDWCGEFLGSFDAIFQLLAVASLTPHHQYLFLTKRPHRLADAITSYSPETMRERLAIEVEKLLEQEKMDLPMSPIPLSNCWLGCSAGTTGTWERFRGWMEKINFAGWHTWLSAEPLLERVNFDFLNAGNWVEWFVPGGESGRYARRCNLMWIRDCIVQADEAGIPTFLKQLGRRPIGPWGPGKQPFGSEKTLWSVKHPKGEDMEEWPDDLKGRRAYPASMVSPDPVLQGAC